MFLFYDFSIYDDNRKEYFEIPWASLRSLVEPSFAERSVINHSEYLPNADIVIATAANVTESEILTEQGQLIGYDYLVIATGHVDTGALARSEKLSHYQAGPETRTKKLSQYQSEGDSRASGIRLLEFIGHRGSRKALDWLTSKKVEVILEQSVNLSSVSDGAYQTSGGETITADCHFNCTGKPMGSSWLRETVLKNSLDIHGRLMVDENLRVKGRTNVFGIGDITDLPVSPSNLLRISVGMVYSGNQTRVFGTKACSGGCQELEAVDDRRRRMRDGYIQACLATAIVSLGRNEAVMQIFFLTMIGCIPGMIKSRDLFVGKTRKQLGLKPDLP
ncbi:hypothetical protein C3L33_16844, partial [Rhododendron williamsianum]